MNAIIYDEGEWLTKVWPRVIADYGLTMNISWVCKRTLGFTVRRHAVRVSDDGHYWGLTTQIHLDFYDESSYTLFALKYK